MRFPVRAIAAETTAEAWRHFPVFYVFCERDEAITLEAQRGMVERVRGQGVVVREEVLGSSHSPFLSVPGKVVRLVEKARVAFEKEG